MVRVAHFFWLTVYTRTDRETQLWFQWILNINTYLQQKCNNKLKYLQTLTHICWEVVKEKWTKDSFSHEWQQQLSRRSDEFQSAIFGKFASHVSVFFGTPCSNVGTSPNLGRESKCHYMVLSVLHCLPGDAFDF